MTSEERRPVIIGVGQLRSNREKSLNAAREPADLIVEALRRAAADSGAGERILQRAERLDIVRVLAWAYDDLPGVVAGQLGITPREAEHSEVGGNQPPKLVDDAARRIAAGELDVALVAGAEAGASVSAFAQAGIEPPWTRQPGGPVRFGRELAGTELVIKHNLTRPIRAYPLYENGLRASLGQTYEESQQWSAEIYSRFSAVAAANDAAWNTSPLSPVDIATVTPRNRMICFPYPLLMNALGAVDQAAAVIVTSYSVALDLGVAPDRMVHVWGGAGGMDSRDILSRVAYDRAPAMAAALSTTLDQAGIGIDAVDVVDLYSCFPCVPKLASLTLGLPPDHPMSITGGLTAFGGPGNNYSTHAIVATARRLRDGRSVGLVYGNGELVTKHHALLLGADAHPGGYVGRPDPVAPPTKPPPPPIRPEATGAAVVETYTVEYDRGGEPSRGFVIGRLDDGARFVANTPDGDPASLAGFVDPHREAVGRGGQVV
ncbi:MAG TPA: hypothetical protein VGF84_01325, partial [Micromonosporaceae bacterium]